LVFDKAAWVGSAMHAHAGQAHIYISRFVSFVFILGCTKVGVLNESS